MGKRTPDIPAAEVRQQLQRIVNHPLFNRGDRMTRFLTFVVEQALAGKSDSIKQRTIAIHAYDRGEDFDPRADPIVRIEATRLRRLLEEYYQTAGAADPCRISIPKGGYAPSFQRPQPEPAAQVSIPKPASSVVRGPHGEPSVGVVFFRNATPDSQHEFLPVGITEELIARLTCFPGLVVVGPLQADSGAELSALGQNVGASFVLHGNVLRYQSRLRVSASLIDVSSGQALWAEQYDRALAASDLLALQDEIVRAIAGAVGDDFGIISRTLAAASRSQQIESLQSYQAVLKARHWVHSLDNATLIEAKRSLEQAIEAEPNYALTKAYLSDIYAIDYHLDLGITGHPHPLDPAEALAREAVALDPYCQTSSWCLAGVHFHRRRREMCLAEVRRMLSLNPNHPMAIGICGLFYTMLGERDQGVEFIETARRLNPHYPTWYHLCLFLHKYCLADYEGALREALLFQSTDLFWPPLLRAAALGQLGRHEDARPELGEMLRRCPDFHMRGAEVMRLTAYTDEHVQSLMDGLNKAGLQQFIERRSTHD